MRLWILSIFDKLVDLEVGKYYNNSDEKSSDYRMSHLKVSPENLLQWNVNFIVNFTIVQQVSNVTKVTLNLLVYKLCENGII